MKKIVLALLSLILILSLVTIPAKAKQTITISDRTGYAEWQSATQYAVNAWNSVGANIEIKWSEGGIGCQPEGSTVPLCRHKIRPTWVGVTYYYYENDTSYILVSDREGFNQKQMNAIALHEVGHSLGLPHSGDPDDVMHYRFDANDQLSPQDHAALRQRHQ